MCRHIDVHRERVVFYVCDDFGFFCTRCGVFTFGVVRAQQRSTTMSSNMVVNDDDGKDQQDGDIENTYVC